MQAVIPLMTTKLQSQSSYVVPMRAALIVEELLSSKQRRREIGRGESLIDSRKSQSSLEKSSLRLFLERGFS